MAPQGERAQILQALRQPPPGGDYVWDGQDEDDRPLAPEELQTARRAPGRPRQAVVKESVTLRLDPAVLAALRARGRGWQTDVAEVLQEAVASGRL